jgi:chromate transporter
VVAAAAVVGWGLGRWAPHTMRTAQGHGTEDDGPAPLIRDDMLHEETPSRTHSLKVLGVGLIAWGVPVGLAAVLGGAQSIFTKEAFFFSGTALVTFGGAYAVLAYVAQKAVTVYGWLGPGEMVRGLAMAETTPGPLVMVVQFVAFVGAYRDSGSLNPWVAAILAALLTTWVTFVPCFVFVFVGAPYVERLRGNRALSSALTGITAAVVGVIANLAVFFAVSTLFGEVSTITWGPIRVLLPDITTIKPVSVAVGLVAAVLLFRLKWSVLRTLGACAVLGVALTAVGPLLTN